MLGAQVVAGSLWDRWKALRRAGSLNTSTRQMDWWENLEETMVCLKKGGGPAFFFQPIPGHLAAA